MEPTPTIPRCGYRSAWAVISAILLVTISCASGSDPTTAAEPAATTEDSVTSNQPAEAAAADPAPTADTANTASEETAANEVFVSPIGEALGVAQDELATAFDTYVSDAEALVRECMAEAGFEYDPTTSGLDRASRRQFELQDSLTAEQFTEQYGFGIATLFELNFEGQGVVDFVNQQFGPAPTEQRSSSEQAAYEMALNGETTQGLTPEEAQEQLFGGDPGTALEGSCRDHGYSTAANPGSVYDGLFSLLGDEIDSLNDRFDNDPRIRDALTQWQTCMAAQGHSYENRFEIIDDLQTRANDLANQFLSSPEVLTALGEAQQQGFASMNDDDRVAFLEDVGALQGFSWVPAMQAEYDELVDFELKAAADSQDCGDDDLFNQVQLELETEFVQTHADQLALIAAGGA